MRIDAVLVRELKINGKSYGTAGLKCVRFKEPVNVVDYKNISELTLDKMPDIFEFSGQEIPFTVSLDRPLTLTVKPTQYVSDHNRLDHGLQLYM